MLIVDPIAYDVVIDRADDQELKITIIDSAGAPLNVTGASFRLTVKESIDDSQASAKFVKSSGSGHFDMGQAASGIVICDILAADIAGLAGDYVFDVEMTLSGKVRTLIPAAAFFVRKDVSTDGATPPAPSVGVTFPDWLGITTYLYMKDFADNKWVKVRMFNRNFEPIAESDSPPPF